MRALALPFLLLAGCTHPSAPASQAAGPAPDGTVQIHATAEGFEPARVEVPAGKPVKLVFTRVAEKTCMTGVVFPELGIEKDLPLNTPVTVELTPKAGGNVTFQCPMAMGKGAVVTLPAS
jgi:plastocyanin domain-containing protein